MNQIIIDGLVQLINRLKNEVSNAYRMNGYEFGNERYKKWKDCVCRFLDDNLPGERNHFEESLMCYGMVSLLDETDEQDFWRNHGNRVKAYLESLIIDIRNGEYEIPQIRQSDDEFLNLKSEDCTMDMKKIFIVHGQNQQIRDKVEAFVRRIGLTPIILCKEASKGQSILDKIISYSDVGFALVLYTGCDEGRVRSTEVECKPRARQNVVFEHGYMIAHLSKERVVALIDDDSVEIPGDYSGVVYIKLSDTDWETQVKKELHAVNIEFDPYA